MRYVISPEQIERFWAKVEPFAALDACWLWTGKRHHRTPYGEHHWQIGGVRYGARAHRLAYELLVGDAGETLDHLCRNTFCVNPDHLEPVSIAENVRRGFSGKRPAAITADGVRLCAQGHEIAGHNAMPVKARPRHPVCRQCAYDGVRRFKERRAA